MRRSNADVKLPDAAKTFNFDEASLKTVTATESSATESSTHTQQLKWADLSETERAAASLAVEPAEWKPLSFMNEAHYNELLRTNALDNDLARRLEAYKVVAGADGK